MRDMSLGLVNHTPYSSALGVKRSKATGRNLFLERVIAKKLDNLTLSRWHAQEQGQPNKTAIEVEPAACVPHIDIDIGR